jgi:pimeloyl-ACP methyl ester carboxylesterase
MNGILDVVLATAGVVVGLPLLSLAVEALRPAPAEPRQLRWAPDVPIRHVDVDGVRLRYIRTGQGPVLVLLHTLRTQLDLFEKVVPELAQHFEVYALDLPGHGYSDIPEGRYAADFFADAVQGFLDALDLRGVTLAGVSIGGAIPLILASRINARISRVVAINPYDYAQGRGMARSSLLARLVVAAAAVPVLGETVMRLRLYWIMKNVLEGGMAEPGNLPPALLKEMYLVGNRKGHYRAFVALLRNAASWEEATRHYDRIQTPVLLLWGNRDWATPVERSHDLHLIPNAAERVVENGGHFLPLDRPEAVVRAISEFCRQQV